MTEVLYGDRRYEITPATLDDVVGIGEAHLQAWLETYPNSEYGVTEEWIKSEFGFLVAEGVQPNGRLNGVEFRRKAISELDANTLYKVVKDEEGEIQGFLHASRTNTNVNLDAIYLTNALKGAGVAQKLMDDVTTFAGNLPISLQVVAYNQRAIAFYERNGFIKGDLELELFHGKMPVLEMKRGKS